MVLSGQNIRIGYRPYDQGVRHVTFRSKYAFGLQNRSDTSASHLTCKISLKGVGKVSPKSEKIESRRKTHSNGRRLDFFFFNFIFNEK